MMKFQRIISIFLIAGLLVSLLSGCEASTDSQEEPTADPSAGAPSPEETEPTQDVTFTGIPVNEHDRGLWYGFLPEDLAGAEADQPVTWK